MCVKDEKLQTEIKCIHWKPKNDMNIYAIMSFKIIYH